ncbi:hypothetical protein GCM10011588_15160 [Nocardia jinanensis]|uniref:Uncharacterized protein n=1 Tax=Nocardia jinanensis TaxID=382504 RepID=A0A917RCE0_9NOCA|nr:hypothetical protein GCM10011588_15160 [Nocardia jinanensis]
MGPACSAVLKQQVFPAIEAAMRKLAGGSPESLSKCRCAVIAVGDQGRAAAPSAGSAQMRVSPVSAGEAISSGYVRVSGRPEHAVTAVAGGRTVEW